MEFCCSISAYLYNNIGTDIDDFEYRVGSWIRKESEGELLDFQSFVKKVKDYKILDLLVKRIIGVIEPNFRSMDVFYTTMLVVRESTRSRYNDDDLKVPLWHVVRLGTEVDMYSKTIYECKASGPAEKKREVINPIDASEDAKRRGRTGKVRTSDQAGAETKPVLNKDEGGLEQSSSTISSKEDIIPKRGGTVKARIDDLPSRGFLPHSCSHCMFDADAKPVLNEDEGGKKFVPTISSEPGREYVTPKLVPAIRNRGPMPAFILGPLKRPERDILERKHNKKMKLIEERIKEHNNAHSLWLERNSSKTLLKDISVEDKREKDDTFMMNKIKTGENEYLRGLKGESSDSEFDSNNGRASILADDISSLPDLRSSSSESSSSESSLPDLVSSESEEWEIELQDNFKDNVQKCTLGDHDGTGVKDPDCDVINNGMSTLDLNDLKDSVPSKNLKEGMLSSELDKKKKKKRNYKKEKVENSTRKRKNGKKKNKKPDLVGVGVKKGRLTDRQKRKQHGKKSYELIIKDEKLENGSLEEFKENEEKRLAKLEIEGGNTDSGKQGIEELFETALKGIQVLNELKRRTRLLDG